MTIAEVSLVSGLSSQTFISRWGDYSCLSVDPADDSTFWFTTEYMKGSGWGTRISSFDLGPLQPPTAFAGEDTTICQDEIYPANAVVTSTQSVQWTTSGDGFFQFPAQANTFYLRGNQDIINGEVTLKVTAYGYMTGTEASDSVLVMITPNPVAFAGNDTLLCTGESLILAGASAAQYDSLLWTTNGDGTFDFDTVLYATYTPGPQDLNNGLVELTLTASGIYPCDVTSNDKIKVTIDECTGLDDISNDEVSLSLIPNPNNGLFDITIEGADVQDLVMQIYNLQGQVVFTYRLGELNGAYKNQVNMTNFPDGIYFVNVRNSEFSKTEKLVVY
jgi:hypothetical protein